MSGVKTSLNDAENMFKKVESEMGKFRNAMKQAEEEDFAALKSAHQAIRSWSKIVFFREKTSTLCSIYLL
ncbi:hypothetical protein [Borrelia turicatae]|uniref:hypothetical protein n=1 Tax=Borrelia turicatae TaxID=142 RepID=UPI0011AB5D3C|nr:hypothetical protein [Borrelia turicatae]UPA14274.1 hypothetical protein bt91E135_001462 [Borrelia turicatae 91E135]